MSKLDERGVVPVLVVVVVVARAATVDNVKYTAFREYDVKSPLMGKI